MRRTRNEGQGEMDLTARPRTWPDAARFPHNFPGDTVRKQVWHDLIASSRPTLITGFTSLEWIVDFLADLAGPSLDEKSVRVLIGFEPRVPATSKRATTPYRSLPQELNDYWLDRGISLHRSSQVIRALEVLDTGRIEVRCSGPERIHAKMYVGDEAVTIGSSNFSASGMKVQLEANVRFLAKEDERRFNESKALAESIWGRGKDFLSELTVLLSQLLSVVSWEEALGRAAAEILEGEWATMASGEANGPNETPLWPSQKMGITQSMWILGNVGSVLIADATGSGKTRMGAHIVRNLIDHNLRTGRARRDLPVMICPPAVEERWGTEANDCGLSLKVYSHGVLSNARAVRGKQAHAAVARAQILAIDEAHNFLNLQTRRSRALLGTLADHVVMFTATPINRGPDDLVSIVDLLGADNFESEVLDVVDQVARRKKRSGAKMSAGEVELVRDALSRFVVRRTKTDFNRLIDLEPDAYLNELDNRCRFPKHNARFYETGETPADKRIAVEIRRLCADLRGLINLRSPIQLYDFQRRDGLTEDRILRQRLRSAPALARWQVTSLLRSSKAALWEHLHGTQSAIDSFRLEPGFKSTDTGDIVSRLGEIAGQPPEIMIDADVPPWLRHDSDHKAACDEEVEIYLRIAELCNQLSEKRAATRARHLFKLWRKSGRVLGFDRSPISLFVMKARLLELGADEKDIVVATGDTSKTSLSKHFRLGSKLKPVIGLCSDALSEGVNLQGASALVHLDLPTVVRTLEQRIGRIDRMDSPHDSIDVHWPKNSPEFSLRSDDRLASRLQVVADLFGANVVMPSEKDPQPYVGDSTPISTKELVSLLEEEQQSGDSWETLKDAFSEVRDLIEGERSIIEQNTYEFVRNSKARVISAISVVRSTQKWCFLAVAGAGDRMPRWVLVRDPNDPLSVDLQRIPRELRELLEADVTNQAFDDNAAAVLDSCLDTLRKNERELLPLRKVGALDEMKFVLSGYHKAAKRAGDRRRTRLIDDLLTLISPSRSEDVVDLRRMADWWLDLIRPMWQEHLSSNRKRRVARLKHLRPLLKNQPLTNEQLESGLDHVVSVPSPDRRVIAAIIGVPPPEDQATSSQSGASKDPARPRSSPPMPTTRPAPPAQTRRPQTVPQYKRTTRG